MAGLDPGELPGYLPTREQGRARPAPAARVVRRAHSLEAQILQRVLRQPGLARMVDADLVSDESPEGRALHAIVAFAREGDAGLTLGQLVAHFEGTEHRAAIEAALAGGSVLDEVPEPDLDLEAELAGLQDKLGQERFARRKAELETRGLAGGLSAAEHAELAGLKARLAAAKGVNQDLESPPKQ
jgi:hypothetical protein